MPRPRLTPAQSQQAAAAYQLGRKAKEAGQQNVPALDVAMMQLIAGNQVGESGPALREWCRGWDDVHHAQTSVALAALRAEADAV